MEEGWKLHHVGVVVGDIDKAIKYYQLLGIGPFEPAPFIVVDGSRRVYGKPVDVKIKTVFAQVGPTIFELSQSIFGESIQKEFLESHGEGVNHLGFLVDDLDKEVAKSSKKGLKVISSGKFVGGGGFAFLNTVKVGGVLFELVQMPPVYSA